MHEGKKLFQCELCPKGFGQKSNLEAHIEYYHQIKKEICQVCGDDFKDKNVLLKCGSCHFDRASNDEVSVEF